MAQEIRIVTEAELQRNIVLDRSLVDVIEKTFVALAEDEVVLPPILSMKIAEANGEVDVKTAYIPGFESFAIKVSPGFFDNPKIGLPSLNGLMLRFSARTGLVEAVCDRANQCETLCELRAARAAGLWPGGSPPELGKSSAGGCRAAPHRRT